MNRAKRLVWAMTVFSGTASLAAAGWSTVQPITCQMTSVGWSDGPHYDIRGLFECVGDCDPASESCHLRVVPSPTPPFQFAAVCFCGNAGTGEAEIDCYAVILFNQDGEGEVVYGVAVDCFQKDCVGDCYPNESFPFIRAGQSPCSCGF